MSFEGLVSNYGYAAIGIGTFFEGETILILGGFAAHRGYLHLPWVVLWAFIGTLLGDQLFFYLGRFKGKKFLEKRPDWQAKSGKVFSLLKKNQDWLILGFRFLYGLRTVTPFIIGASQVSPLRFLLLNILGALIWATIIGTLGYLFGHTFEILIGDIKKYELVLFVLLSAIGILLWGYHFRHRRSAKQPFKHTQ